MTKVKQVELGEDKTLEQWRASDTCFGIFERYYSNRDAAENVWKEDQGR